VEWLKFPAAHPGTPPTGSEFHDGASADRIALDDGQYLVLAAREGEELIRAAGERRSVRPSQPLSGR
jgi:hypothetical protein